MNRRQILSAGLALGAGSRLVGPAFAARVDPTPAQTEGPFYPDSIPLDHDADLLRFAGAPGDVKGTPAEVVGQVLDAGGRPVRGITVEIWQCDAMGYYHHVKEYSGGDPHFQGFGRTQSGEDGSYRFRTIRPVPYGARTPHIHFQLRGRGIEELTTQLYIRGHEMNARDFVLARVPGHLHDRVMADFKPRAEGGPALARFDIVLDGDFQPM